MSIMKIICDRLNEIFTHKNRCKCWVSIKSPKGRVISKETTAEMLSVENLCRDSEAKFRDTEDYKKTDHTILGNSPFTVIVHNVFKNHRNQLFRPPPPPPPILIIMFAKIKTIEQLATALIEPRNPNYMSEIVVPIIAMIDDSIEYDLLRISLC